MNERLAIAAMVFCLTGCGSDFPEGVFVSPPLPCEQACRVHPTFPACGLGDCEEVGFRVLSRTAGRSAEGGIVWSEQGGLATATWLLDPISVTVEGQDLVFSTSLLPTRRVAYQRLGDDLKTGTGTIWKRAGPRVAQAVTAVARLNAE